MLMTFYHIYCTFRYIFPFFFFFFVAILGFELRDFRLLRQVLLPLQRVPSPFCSSLFWGEGPTLFTRASL
jgi:hypothetical protein